MPLPRPAYQIHPARAPVPARLAATLLLLRDDAQGLQVLMTRRNPQASFVPGAWVFPGGALDPSDTQAHALADFRPAQATPARSEALAAIRETWEELGVLLARRPNGDWVDDSDLAGLQREADLYAQVRARGWRLAADALQSLSRWVTDRDLPKRFDVPFWVAAMPPGQTPLADQREQFEPLWISPAQALARHAAGDFELIFPTLRTLEQLRDWPHAAHALARCAADEAPLLHSCPRTGWLGGAESRHMEHEAPYGELALVCPDGQIAHPLDWQSERAVPLLRHVQRLTAPNPGRMTGPGTNSYVLGEPATGYLVIDPGPDDAGHIARLAAACAGDVRAIVCTHSHPDHAPGAWRLQRLCSPQPPVLGSPSGPHARPEHHFKPDRVLQDQELLTLSGSAKSADLPPTPWHTLRVLHTPGHAANHLCLLLHEDGLLFTGDHILNGSTSVVAPPDGQMAAYLASLDKLEAACEQWGVHYLLPAHGHVLGGPERQACAAIAQLRAHRWAREAKVARAMRSQPGGNLDSWLALAYDDVPSALWPVARLSLLAHVQHLQARAAA